MKELFDLVASSPELQKRLIEILSKGEEEGPAAVETALVAFAGEQGFRVTMAEAMTFFEGMQASCELGEAELDMVGGGKLNTVLVSVLNTGWGCGAIPDGARASPKEGAVNSQDGSKAGVVRSPRKEGKKNGRII